MRLPVSGGLPLNATCTRFLAQKLDGASCFSERKGGNPRPKKEKSHLSVHLSRAALAIGPNADHVTAFSPPFPSLTPVRPALLHFNTLTQISTVTLLIFFCQPRPGTAAASMSSHPFSFRFICTADRQLI
ncbi:hypothetical protein NPIL_218021 [Nephila pilipes]|uniref:Uncharacterized protein n=1 Tax=Nephila pilipes TaxID=299642 RepID=A0A8X6P602_NEPPI|nr:hypothetical protein NPIL_218021 [Nephila pilipes]